MAQWNKCVITDTGLELIAKTLTGQSISFTKAMWGVGIPPSLAEQTALQFPVEGILDPEAKISDVSQNGNIACVTIQLSNSGLTEPVNIRECCLFARDPDTGQDVLFSYLSTLDGSPMDVNPMDRVGDIKSVEMTFFIERDVILTAVISSNAFVTVNNF